MRNVTKTLKMLATFMVSMFVFVSFGYAQMTTLLTESFEAGTGTTPPAGWVIEQVTGTTPGISFVTTSTSPTVSAAYDGTTFVRYNSYSISSGSTRLKRTNAVSTTNKAFIMVDFAWYEDPGYSSSQDQVEVQWSTDGTTWNSAGTYPRYNATAGWKVKYCMLPSGASNQATLYVGFLFTSAYGNNCALDFAHVTAGPPPPPAFGTIGTGTSTSGYPYYTFYMGSRTQMLYTAAELTAAGVPAGNLTSIGFNIVSAYPQVMQNFTVKIGHTTATSLTAFVSGLSTYYQVNYGVPGTGWRDINLTTPFVWNGTSNVIVEICFGDNGSYTSNSTVNGSSVSGRVWHYHLDNYVGCTGTGAGAVQSYLPNIRFGIPPITPGVLMGYVRDINTLAPISGAIVQVGTKKDTSRSSGFYIIYNLNAGSVTANCTAAGYINGSATATIVNGQATMQDILMAPGPKVGGVVTDGSNGNPIVGATIKVAGTVYTMTVAGGSYLTPLLSLVGAQTLEIEKTGYDPFTTTVNLVPNQTFTQDAQLLPTAVQPGPFVATLNGTPGTAVNLNWQTPSNLYQLIYDDGIQDNFAIWATANNLNAMKFTPLQWPVKLVGGKVNLGTAANYPANALPLSKFWMYVYKADGTGGVPGTVIDSVEITPGGFGWADFAFAVPITIATGDFYLVMKQGGVPPHAAGLGVDLTNPQLRSYSKFVAGGTPWIPAAGNFQIRAIVQGVGGPLDASLASTNKNLIEASMPAGLIYETPVANQQGYEGVASVEAYNWANMQNNIVTPMATNLTPYTGPVSPKSDVGIADPNFVGGVVSLPDATAATLYDNGPMVNSPGTGAGGADESMLQGPINSYGMNMINGTYRMADDFSVSGGVWNVSSLEFYGYQTGSPTTSTFTGAYVRIFQGTPGGTVTTVWGDNTTNRLSSTSFTNIYRVSATGNTQRPIMKIVVNTAGLTLQPGSYWIEFSATGSLASGPWCPPITINNTPTTGNALIYVESTGTYENYEVGASAPYYQQGVPFKLFGTLTPIVTNMSYQVWRLQQGQEGNQSAWTSIYTGTTNSTVDNSWPSLPNGPYRWAVKAIYSPPGQRPSPPTFSNVIGKGWTANVDVCVTLTCAANPKAGTTVKLINVDYPDTTYTRTTDTTGCVHFANVWKGNYTLSVVRFSYPNYTQNVTIMGDATFNVTLLQNTAPVTNLAVDNRTLLATWSPPKSKTYIIDEPFTNLTANQWVIDGANWSLYTGLGNPAPSIRFSWTPSVTNYNQYVTSKTLAGIHAPYMKLQWDVNCDYYSTSGTNTLAVEVWNGTAWQVLKTYNSTANIPWTTDEADISSLTNSNFKVRFHAAGDNSSMIDYWYVDNVKVYGTDVLVGGNPCVLGYNFYLNGVLSAFTPDTTYQIPPNQVVYGQNYHACVRAVYGSGYSAEVCTDFICKFLYPARNLAGEGVECSAYLTWQKPQTAGDGPGIDQSRPAASGTGPASETGVGSNAGLDMNYRVTPDATATVFESGPFVNSPGTGVGGADESSLQSGMTLYGSNMNQSLGYSMADDFVVPAGGWSPTKFTFFGYQTGSPTSGTFTGLYFRLYNGPPNAGGTVVWGDLTTNRLTSQVWSNCYRVNTIGGDNQRAIMNLDCNISGMTLNQGTYWLEVQTTGSGSSGPWANPIVINGTLTTGNGIQWTGSAWQDWVDGSYQQGLPFRIEYPGSGGGGEPAGLIGYNIYRNGNLVHTVGGKDTLFWYDYNLNPGTYNYDVMALYDLTTYGFPPPPLGESLGNTAGIQNVQIVCGRPLPFYEPWDQGQFAYNDWTFTPDQGHWTMNTGIGNPAPSADFSWQPATANYSSALVSPVIDASPWTCASIFLDYDLKLIDRNSTGDEKLTVDIFYNGSWHQKAEYTNNGSTEWLPKHIDISVVKGKSFRIRFVANGVNTADLLHWYVDNIHAYGVCNKAKTLAATQSQFTTNLTWVAPECTSIVPTVLVKLFQWSGTPDNGYYQQYNYGYGVVYDLAPYADATLNKIDFHHASWGTTGIWQYNIHVVDWATYTELATIGPLTTTGDDKWENNVPLGGIAGVGGKQIGIMLEPLSNSSTDAYPCFSADNIGPDGVSVYGALPSYSSFGTSGIGDFLQNLWIEVPAIDGSQLVQPRKVNVKPNATASTTKTGVSNNPAATFLMTNQSSYVSTPDVADSSILFGYNVYRTAETGIPPYTKQNSAPLTVTSYTDTYPSTLVSGIFKYYVTTIYKNSADNQILCEPSSDTLQVIFPAVGINELNNSQIMVYPNPATEVVYVKSDYRINTVEIMNYVGQTVNTISNIDVNNMKINVATLKAGVYFVKVTTTEGVRSVKITVTH